MFPVVQREPDVFFDALTKCAWLKRDPRRGSSGTLAVLKKPGEAPPEGARHLVLKDAKAHERLKMAL